jgi:hypothetical protein
MPARTLALVMLALLWSSLPSPAADHYEITSTDGKKAMTYQVIFGGTRFGGRLTAFCPKQKLFVYLTWDRDSEKPPEPVSVFWDSRTGETVKLYRFPGSPDPLPAIQGIEDLRVCPFTGDKKFKKVCFIRSQ